jgi:protein ImuA
VNKLKTDSANRLAGLKRLHARIEHQWHRPDASRLLPLGHGAIDTMLGGGLASAQLHEVFAGETDDAASAAGFAAMLARQRGGAVIWIRDERAGRSGGHLHGEGLVEIGLDPASLLLCLAPDAAGVLKAANEAARCPQVATVIAELWRRVPELSLTASRRLALSAENSGATLLMLRVGAEPEPSAAATRWSVAAAPSDWLSADPLAANAPGHIALDLSLLRQRGRAGEGAWRVVWDRDNACFTEPHAQSHATPLHGAVGPISVVRQDDVAHGGADGGAGERRAA